MPEDDIEIGEEVDVEVVRDDSGEMIGAVVDDVVVATGPEGSVVDETIDVLDSEGNLLLEDETVSFYDADANLISTEETVAIALEDE
jgi:folate-dependent tRNA-U54 methylase TrmFO/GidA